MNTFEIWTDGACCGNGTLLSRGGCGIFIPSQNILPHDIAIAHRLDKYNDRSVTNNIAELYALKIALEWIHKSMFDVHNIQFTLYSDSQYSINCITTWRNGWTRNHFKLSSGSPIKNLDLIQDIWKLYDTIPYIQFKYVKAHVNKNVATRDQQNNQKADDLATSCIYDNEM